MKVIYDDNLHTYTTEDGVILKSVTEIASSICKVNTDYLRTYKQDSAIRGTKVHNILAEFYNTKEFKEDESEEINTIARQIINTFPSVDDGNVVTEVMVYNLDKGYAGTTDYLLLENDNKTVLKIVDFKTGTVNKKYVTIQLNLYRLALESMGYDVSNCKLIVVSKESSTEVQLLDYDSIMALQDSSLVLEQEQLLALQEIENKMKKLLPFVEEYKTLESMLKEELMECFVQTETNSFNSSACSYSFVKPTTSKTFDSTKFKKENPEMYNQYLKDSTRAGYVKMSFKGDDND